MIERVDTLTMEECSLALGEVNAALAQMERAIATHSDDSDNREWRNRTDAAMKHRRRDARMLVGRMLSLTLDRAREMPGETSTACLFVAAATALLPPLQLQQVWDAVEALER